jgi:hypothetical protein
VGFHERQHGGILNSNDREGHDFSRAEKGFERARLQAAPESRTQINPASAAEGEPILKRDVMCHFAHI